MMQFTKKGLLIPSIAILLVAVASHANGALIVKTSGTENVTYDDATDKYWYWNLEDLDSKTWAQQLNAIGDLNSGDGYYGFIDWHAADYGEMNSLWGYVASVIGGSFYPSVVGAHTDYQEWKGRYDSIAPGTDPEHYYGHIVHHPIQWTKYDLETYHVPDTLANNKMSVWAVSTGTVIPEPSTLAIWSLLAVSGLTVVCWRRRK